MAGANGFVGSHLVEEFARRGNEVFALSRRRPHALPQHAVWVPWEPDVFDGQALRAVSTVVNAVAGRDHRSFPGGIRDQLDANVAATARLVGWAAEHKTPTFVQISTGSVYGPGQTHREDSAAQPDAFWTATRRAAERIVVGSESFAAAVVPRLYFPYGPGQSDKLIPGLARRIRDGVPVELHGHPDGMRLAPIWVRDAAEAIADLAERGKSQIVNVAGAEVVSLRRLAELIGDVVGRAPEFTHHPDSAGRDFVPDLGRMHAVLAPRTLVSLHEGLARTFGP